MSKTQLQTNNTKYSQLIESLRGKAVSDGSGEIETVTIRDDD